MLRLELSPDKLAHQMIEGETALLWPHLHLSQINAAWMRRWGHWEYSGANQETLLSCHGINPPGVQLSCVCCVSASSSNVCNRLSFSVQYLSVSFHCVSIRINKSYRSCSMLAKNSTVCFQIRWLGLLAIQRNMEREGYALLQQWYTAAKVIKRGIWAMGSD